MTLTTSLYIFLQSPISANSKVARVLSSFSVSTVSSLQLLFRRELARDSGDLVAIFVKYTINIRGLATLEPSELWLILLLLYHTYLLLNRHT